MPRRRRRRRAAVRYVRRRTRRRAKTIPLAPILGFASAFFVPSEGRTNSPFENARQGNWNGAVAGLMQNITGYDPLQKSWGVPRGLIAMIVGVLIHKFVGGYLGINRILGRAKVPLIRL